jgi:hypothetical protein
MGSGSLLLLTLLREVSLAFIVRCAFWFRALVIEGAALKLLQAFRERLDPKLSSLAYLSSFVITRRHAILPSSQNYK